MNSLRSAWTGASRLAARFPQGEAGLTKPGKKIALYKRGILMEDKFVDGGFSPEVGAGTILLGSCPGGVASNVMTFLAHGNVPLSVTMTVCSTLMAPLVTPTLMELLAGRLVPIPFVEMMISIIKMIVLPIAAGLIANRLLRERRALIDRVLPTVAMAAICGVNAIITANSRDKLLAIGLLLIVASILHNFIGYALGYAGARLTRLSVTDSRTVAIEVGMQNGGMAAGLAIEVLRSANAALAPTIFGTVMNASGAALASWWRGKPSPGAAGVSQPALKAIPSQRGSATMSSVPCRKLRLRRKH